MLASLERARETRAPLRRRRLARAAHAADRAARQRRLRRPPRRRRRGARRPRGATPRGSSRAARRPARARPRGRRRRRARRAASTSPRWPAAWPPATRASRSSATARSRARRRARRSSARSATSSTTRAATARRRTVAITVGAATAARAHASTDEGPGLAPTRPQRAFERFWRGPGASGEGSGLGLAIVRAIAERHGGTRRRSTARASRSSCPLSENSQRPAAYNTCVTDVKDVRMKRLRTISTRRLLASSRRSSSSLARRRHRPGRAAQRRPKPAPKPLDRAVYDAARTRPKVDGRHAPGSTSPTTCSPPARCPRADLAAARRRRRAACGSTDDGRFRLELQSDAGDAQIVSDGKQLHRLRRELQHRVPRRRSPAATRTAARPTPTDQPPTLDQVDKALDRARQTWTLSGAQPDLDRRPARPTPCGSRPKDDGGLLGAAELAWDADNGVPLRAAVYAQGQSRPGARAQGDRRLLRPDRRRPTSTSRRRRARKVVDLSSPPAAGATTGAGQPGSTIDAASTPSRRSSTSRSPPRTRSPACRARTSGSSSTANERRRARHLRQGPRRDRRVPAARPAPAEPAARSGGGGGDHSLRLPQVNINGATGTELATALGTVVTFERDGVDYVVAGSVAAAVAAETRRAGEPPAELSDRAAGRRSRRAAWSSATGT